MNNNRKKNAIILVARAPEKGKVKTRLAPYLSDNDILTLYINFLIDTFEKMRKVDAKRFIGYYSEIKSDFFYKKFSDFSIIKQEGSNLGERLKNLFKTLFDENFKSVAAIGADTPHLPLPFIESAFKALKNGSDAVIGPSEDGGYYLIGLNKFVPEIFEGIKWGFQDVFETTVKKCKNYKLKTYILEKFYDIDTPEELIKFFNSCDEELKSHIFLKIIFKKI